MYAKICVGYCSRIAVIIFGIFNFNSVAIWLEIDPVYPNIVFILQNMYIRTHTLSATKPSTSDWKPIITITKYWLISSEGKTPLLSFNRYNRKGAST